jgi:hypothetical protein
MLEWLSLLFPTFSHQELLALFDMRLGLSITDRGFDRAASASISFDR